MEELIKHKIFTMEAVKRDTLFTVAMEKFTKSGYRKTTTDEIISEAGISKGLLFHYFGTKKDLYIFLYKYANVTIMQDFYGQINMREKDILERLRQMFLLKIELTNKYPSIFDFVASAFYEKDPAVVTEISEYTNQFYIDAQKEIFKDIDLSLFKVDLDIQKAINIIIYTFRGYSEAQGSAEKRTEDYRKEYKRYIKDIDEYIEMLRASFYKEGQQHEIRL